MRNDRILLAHGSGGKLSAELIQSVFVPAFGNPSLARLDDSAVVDLAVPGDARGRLSASGRLAISTDCHVVKPLFFKGGDIGRLAICGTVNDLAMVGARPLYLAAGFVLEEGLPISTLQQVVASMRSAAEEAGVAVVTGDTKVVERGSADGLFVTTTGVGVVPEGIDVSGSNARPGDTVLLSGPIGDHGIAVLSRREGLEFGVPVASDVAPLNRLVEALLEASPHLRSLRDPTRGGLATTLNELAAQSRVAIRIEEEQVPVRPAVQAACEMLGFDPLYVANEGKLVAIVPAEEARQALDALRGSRYGEDACIIGSVLPEPMGKVFMKTRIGGTRVVQMLMGEMLPRIC
ncbi:MAG: hydrogenase expression/formation protein HypE [Chloroflexota bacterium]